VLYQVRAPIIRDPTASPRNCNAQDGRSLTPVSNLLLRYSWIRLLNVSILDQPNRPHRQLLPERNLWRVARSDQRTPKLRSQSHARDREKILFLSARTMYSYRRIVIWRIAMSRMAGTTARPQFLSRRCCFTSVDSDSLSNLIP
jgi:hypothetical protein